MRFIALDTETTGLGHEFHRLIEIAAVEFDAATGEPTGNTFYTLLNPQCEVSAEAAAVHGKTLEDLKDQPLFPEIAPELLSFIADSEVVIHNAPFDLGFLDAELKRAGLPEIRKTVAAVTDTLALSRRHVRAKVHTLDALCDRYGVDRTKRTLHGALVDCEMLARVYPVLLREVDVIRSRLNAVLPFELDSELPADLESTVERYLHLSELVKILQAEEKRHTAAIKQMAKGVAIEGDFYTIEFQNRNNTNWDKVTSTLLADVDLSSYRQKSSAMYVRHR